MKRLTSALIGAVLFLSSGSLLAANSKAPPTKAAPTIENPLPLQSDDPEINSIIGQLKQIIHSALHGTGVSFQKLLGLLKRLAVVLKSYFGKIDDQIQSSKCHNRDCTDYGTKP